MFEDKNSMSNYDLLIEALDRISKSELENKDVGNIAQEENRTAV